MLTINLSLLMKHMVFFQIKNSNYSTIKPEEQLKQGKDLIKKEVITNKNKIIGLNIINSIAERMKKWINMIDLCSKSNSRG